MSSKEHAGVVSGLDKLYEFDREPVTDDKLQPGKYFAGLLAGEHVAGTEFVIGASFVSWGASPMNVFLGLALGNLLAVLTWTFMCAPIATQTRLTLYWYLRKIAGPAATAIWLATPSPEPIMSTRSIVSASSIAGTIKASW